MNPYHKQPYSMLPERKKRAKWVHLLVFAITIGCFLLPKEEQVILCSPGPDCSFFLLCSQRAPAAWPSSWVSVMETKLYVIGSLEEDVLKGGGYNQGMSQNFQLNYLNRRMKLSNICNRCQLPKIWRMSFIFPLIVGNTLPRHPGERHWNTQWQTFRAVEKFCKCLLVQSLRFCTWGLSVRQLSSHFYKDFY